MIQTCTANQSPRTVPLFLKSKVNKFEYLELAYDEFYENFFFPSDSDSSSISSDREFHITSLNLSHSVEATDSSLTRFFSLTRSLVHVDLSYCVKASDLSVEALALCTGGQLRSLSVSHCPDLSDRSVASLCTHCPNLSSLNLAACYKITDASIHLIVNHLKVSTQHLS
jgi:hypothetical protein